MYFVVKKNDIAFQMFIVGETFDIAGRIKQFLKEKIGEFTEEECKEAYDGVVRISNDDKYVLYRML